MLQEPFEQYIQKILKKTSTQPVLKLPPSSVSSQEENYEVIFLFKILPTAPNPINIQKSI